MRFWKKKCFFVFVQQENFLTHLSTNFNKFMLTVCMNNCQKIEWKRNLDFHFFFLPLNLIFYTYWTIELRCSFFFCLLFHAIFVVDFFAKKIQQGFMLTFLTLIELLHKKENVVFLLVYIRKKISNVNIKFKNAELLHLLTIENSLL